MERNSLKHWIWGIMFVKVQPSWDMILKPIRKTSCWILGSNRVILFSWHTSHWATAHGHRTCLHRHTGAYQLPISDSHQCCMLIFWLPLFLSFSSQNSCNQPGISGFIRKGSSEPVICRTQERRGKIMNARRKKNWCLKHFSRTQSIWFPNCFGGIC